MIDIPQLTEARQIAYHDHRRWKASIAVNTAFALNDWEVLWPDNVAEKSDPLVENIYSQALEDKIATAGATLPMVYVPPPRGTRSEQREGKAQTRRRVYRSYWDRSRHKRNLKALYQDWFHAGATYLTPWTNWQDENGIAVPSAGRFPYQMRVDPAQVFPLDHSPVGDLTHVLIARQRTLRALEKQWGPSHPAFQFLTARRARNGQTDKAKFYEELWYYDGNTWAVALADNMQPSQYQGEQYTTGPVSDMSSTLMEWLIAPEAHGLPGCPVSEAKRTAPGSGYRGAIEDIIPILKTANNFAARLLDDLEANIFAPVVLDNVANPEEWGVGAVMVGTGTGEAKVIRDRPPVNFEAQQTVAGLLDQARRQAFEPQQRSGESGASIVSGKGTMALMGSFNAELAWAQTDIESVMERSNQVTAAFDEAHCAGVKSITGFEGTRPYEETYDPTVLFAGDYRVTVTYGDSKGLDEQNRLVRLATAKNLGGMSTRTFIRKSGIVEDEIEEEREMATEKLLTLFMDGVLPQTVQSGDMSAIRRFVDKIDDDKMTYREAALAVIKEMEEPAPAGPQPGTPGPERSPRDAIQMIRSLGSGGIPGQAAGLPLPGPELAGMLPGGTRRLQQEVQPGGTAT